LNEILDDLENGAYDKEDVDIVLIPPCECEIGDQDDREDGDENDLPANFLQAHCEVIEKSKPMPNPPTKKPKKDHNWKPEDSQI